MLVGPSMPIGDWGERWHVYLDICSFLVFVNTLHRWFQHYLEILLLYYAKTDFRNNTEMSRCRGFITWVQPKASETYSNCWTHPEEIVFFFYHSWGTFRKLINFISGWKTSEIRAILSSLWRFSCPSCLCSLPLPPPSSPLPCQEQPFASLFFPGSKNPSPPKRAFSWSIAASNNSSNFFNNINRSYPERYANIYCLEIWSSAFLSKQVWYVRVCVCFSNFFPFTRG